MLVDCLAMHYDTMQGLARSAATARCNTATVMASQHASVSLPSFDAGQIDWDVVAEIIDEVPLDAGGIDALNDAHDRVMQRL